MAARGRPPLTEDVLRQRIADYCTRHGVAQLNAAGFPPYPTGSRETPQHREWVVLYKAFSRLRARTAATDAPARAAAVAAQKGRCPICLDQIGADGEIAAALRPPDRLVIVHAPCNELLRLAVGMGPEALDHARGYLWPAETRPAKLRKRR